MHSLQSKKLVNLWAQMYSVHIASRFGLGIMLEAGNVLSYVGNCLNCDIRCRKKGFSDTGVSFWNENHIP